MRKRSALLGAALAGLTAFVALAGASAIAAPSHSVKSEHWGVMTRNTIGSPVGDLRDGPYAPFGVTGDLASPPFGKGSLGIEVANGSEKVDFGNETDFLGDPVLALNQTGFHVYQTGENVSSGGPRNMPNIRFEIDPNLNPVTCPAGDDYTTMVWNPPTDPAPVNRWSGYIDATSTGDWFFTGAEGACTACSLATPCTFAVAKTKLNDGAPDPIFYTVAVGKGRDNPWVGAVDGFRMNSDIYDFEDEPKGVHVHHVGPSGPSD